MAIFLPQARSARASHVGRRTLLAPIVLIAAIAVAIAAHAAWSAVLPEDGMQVPREVSASAFVAGASPRALLSRRDGNERSDSPITMEGSARRQNRYNHPKKLEVRFNDKMLQMKAWDVMPENLKFTWKPDPTLETWSQTLKLTFPEGEDEVVTEEEVMQYFTTDEYTPEAVIVGHKLPHSPLANAYVHFGTNGAARKARKEKDGGKIGKASEVKVVYTDEKKWVRLRDGVSLTGGRRAAWMKPYGQKAYPGWSDDWAEDTGTRSHPVYPED